ncbi:MAG: single-stranded-DNA-specific exonuclease RecJ [Gammaproteobacteria bacterium]
MTRTPIVIARRAAPLRIDGLHPLLCRIYAHRGITDAGQLESSLTRLHACEDLSGMDAATRLLMQALEQGSRILIVGDFDADGATSTALAMRVLRAFGAGDVHYLVPNRFEYGYGLTPEIVAVGARLAPDLLITVDNGVSSVEGVAAAKACGMRVLITDHHLPGARLPDADAIVNPNLPGDDFPSKTLAGVGVVFYLMLALRKRLRAAGWFDRCGLTEPNMARVLDLVALGTVADVVPLDHNNRILVEQGLRRIRAGHCIPAIPALLRIAGRSHARAVAADLGFAAAPRLNAAGRLQDMSIGIECLLCDDEERAAKLVAQLDELNRRRRAIESEMHVQALAALQALDGLEGHGLPHGLCLFDAGWHQGVIGILASRIKERFQRPTIVFADAGQQMLKGSARSIPALHIRDVLETVAARNPGLITRFGGHAMAAGLSLPARHFEDFRAAFALALRAVITPEQLDGVQYTDGELCETDFTLDVAQLLRMAGPWGQGFPEPLFEGVFEIVQQRRVGERHLKLVVRPRGGTRLLDAIVFNIDAFEWTEGVRAAHLLYRFEENEYLGRVCPQLAVTHLRPLPP